MSKQPLLTTGLALASFVAMLLLLWAIPLAGPLASSFSTGAINAPETSPFLGTYQWTAPRGALRIPLQWWVDRVIVRQQLSAGQTARELNLHTTRGNLRFTIEAGQIRTYHYLVPAKNGWLETDFSIPPFVPSADDPRQLGMVIASNRIDYPSGAHWPSPAPLALALLAPLAARAGAAWRMGRLRWLLALALGAAVLLSYRVDSIQTLATGPMLALGAIWASIGGWLLGRLCQTPPSPDQREGGRRGEGRNWPSLALALSLGFSLVPLLLIFIGMGEILPAAWPLLAGPLLIALIVALVPGSRPYQTLLAGLAAASALLWAGLYDYVDAIIRAPSDFQAYYDAARRLLSGQPLYDLAALSANPFATTYKYPPIGALLISPLALLPLPTAGMLWRLLCIGAAAAGALGLAHGVRSSFSVGDEGRKTKEEGSSTPPGYESLSAIGYRLSAMFSSVIALSLLVALSPVSRSLRFGQPELLIFAAAVLGTALLLHGRIWWSAAIWSLIALVKIYPLLLVIPLLIVGRRRWAIALTTCTLGWTALSSTIGGWDLVFWRDLFPSLGARDGRLSNLSIYGVVARLIDPTAYTGGVAVPGALLPAILLGGGLYTIAALLIWRRRKTLRAQLWEALGLMVCTLLLILPVSWDHYHALLLLPLIVSLGALSPKDSDTMLWLGAYSLLIFGVSRDIWPPDGATPGTLVMFFGSYRAVGVLLLWIWFARRFVYARPAEITP